MHFSGSTVFWWNILNIEIFLISFINYESAINIVRSRIMLDGWFSSRKLAFKGGKLYIEKQIAIIY